MRQAIIERVARKVYYNCQVTPEIEEHVCTVLEAAGFFELLEAAEGTYKDFERFGAMDNMGLRLATGYVLSCRSLNAAIARAKGDQP